MTARCVDIRQARTGLSVKAGKTILDAALAAGIPFPHGCRSGRCGSCKSRLIAGEVEMLQHSRFALTDDEKAAGLILACRARPVTDATVAWLDEDDIQPARRLAGTVTAIEDLTHDIKRVRIKPQAGDPLLFTAGQYAQVGFDGVPARSYSMADWRGDAALEFHIRHVPGGITSGHVHRALRIGDRTTLDLPLGASFLRQHHTGPILCIAGGSGLAPIKAIVESALAHGMRQPIHVYFGVRAERDLYLVEHFQALARRHPGLAFTPVLSEERSARYRTGFVAEAVAEDLSNLDGWKAYVAGPPPMVDAAMRVAFARQLRTEDLHADVFFTPATEQAPVTIGGLDVRKRL